MIYFVNMIIYENYYYYFNYFTLSPKYGKTHVADIKHTSMPTHSPKQARTHTDTHTHTHTHTLSLSFSLSIIFIIHKTRLLLLSLFLFFSLSVALLPSLSLHHTLTLSNPHQSSHPWHMTFFGADKECAYQSCK